MKKTLIIFSILLICMTALGAKKFYGDFLTPGGTASVENAIKLSSESSANLSALARDAGRIYYDSTLGSLVVDNGSTLVAAGGSSVFDDAAFTVQDQAGDSLGIFFDVSAVTGTDKTITFPDANVNLGLLANTSLSNLSSVAVNTALISDADKTDNLGSVSNYWNDLFAHIGTFSAANATVSLQIQNSSKNNVGGFSIVDAMPSGATTDLSLRTNGAGTINDLGIFTGNSASTSVATGFVNIETGNLTNASAAVPTGSILVKSGNNASTGAFDSGNVTLQTGTVVGGTRGIVDLNSDYINFLDSDDLFVEDQRSTYWWGDVTGIYGDSVVLSGNANNVLNYATTDTNVAANATSDLNLETGTNTAASSTGSTGSIWIHSGDKSNSSVSGNTGGVEVATGSITGNGNSGLLLIGTGGISGTGTSGNVMLQTGTASTRGDIEFRDGTEGTIGHVWTQSSAQGAGGWAAIPSDATKANTTLNNLGTTSINANLLFNASTTYSLGSETNPGANAWFNGYLGTGAQPYAYRSSGVTRILLNTNTTYPDGTANSYSWNTANAVTNNFGMYTVSQSTTVNSGRLLLMTGNVVDGNAGRVSLRAGKASGTGNDGYVEVLSAMVMHKVTADPCANATEFPEGSLFYNDTSDYMCFCDGAGADLQVHSPATACF